MPDWHQTWQFCRQGPLQAAAVLLALVAYAAVIGYIIVKVVLPLLFAALTALVILFVIRFAVTGNVTHPSRQDHRR